MARIALRNCITVLFQIYYIEIFRESRILVAADKVEQLEAFANPMKESTGLETILSSFRCHSLKDLDKCQLMNRVDTKFLVPIHLLEDVLEAIKPHCSSLKINERQIFEYFTTYYDREDLHYYFSHHNGRLNRHKIRCRTYVDSDDHFLEVKFKNNKKRTVKTRVVVKSGEQTNALNGNFNFLAEQGVSYPEKLVATQHCSYRRLAFAGNDLQERLTLDLNLCFRDTKHDNQVPLPEFFILELKQSKIDRFSKLYQAITDLQIKPNSFSKYCMGMTLLRGNNLKRNNFKPVLREVDKLRSTFNAQKVS